MDSAHGFRGGRLEDAVRGRPKEDMVWQVERNDRLNRARLQSIRHGPSRSKPGGGGGGGGASFNAAPESLRYVRPIRQLAALPPTQHVRSRRYPPQQRPRVAAASSSTHGGRGGGVRRTASLPTILPAHGRRARDRERQKNSQAIARENQLLRQRLHATRASQSVNAKALQRQHHDHVRHVKRRCARPYVDPLLPPPRAYVGSSGGSSFQLMSDTQQLRANDVYAAAERSLYESVAEQLPQIKSDNRQREARAFRVWKKAVYTHRRERTNLRLAFAFRRTNLLQEAMGGLLEFHQRIAARRQEQSDYAAVRNGPRDKALQLPTI